MLFGFPTFQLWAYLLKVILEMCGEQKGYLAFQPFKTLSVPVEGYSRNVWWAKSLFGFPTFQLWAYLLKVILKMCGEQKGYLAFQPFNFEHTCWSLF